MQIKTWAAAEEEEEEEDLRGRKVNQDLSLEVPEELSTETGEGVRAMVLWQGWRAEGERRCSFPREASGAAARPLTGKGVAGR